MGLDLEIIVNEHGGWWAPAEVELALAGRLGTQEAADTALDRAVAGNTADLDAVGIRCERADRRIRLRGIDADCARIAAAFPAPGEPPHRALAAAGRS